jgi:predicted PhzF superfamily epimerase YddE/YHI9
MVRCCTVRAAVAKVNRGSLRFRLVNVFVEDSPWSGNALAVMLLARHGSSATRQSLAYVWAPDRDGQVIARFFFLKHGAVVEDPGTGSACANLGGWHLATGAPLPIDLVIRQGEKTGRRCRLRLRVDASKRVFVSGRVVEVGRGELTSS